MSDQLESLSDPFKEFLQSCGINPHEYQQGIALELLAKKARKSPGTKTNKEYYERSARVETIASVAKRIQEAKPKVYIPLGYVMYERHNHCRNCGLCSYCLDAPSLFLMQTDKVESSTRIFQPVAAVEYPNLPHWIKTTSTETLFCLECYSDLQLPETTALAPSSKVQSTDEAPVAGGVEQSSFEQSSSGPLSCLP